MVMYRDALLVVLRAPTSWLREYLPLVLRKATEAHSKHVRLVLALLSQYFDPDAILEPSLHGFRVHTSYFTEYCMAVGAVMEDVSSSLPVRQVKVKWEESNFLKFTFHRVDLHMWWDIFFALYSDKEATLKNARAEAQKGALDFNAAFRDVAAKLYRDAAELPDTFKDLTYSSNETHEEHFIRHYTPLQLELPLMGYKDEEHEW